MNTCLHCGGEFLRRPGAGRPAKYCGDRCRLARRRLASGARVPCAVCGDPRPVSWSSANTVICRPCRRRAHGLAPDQPVNAARALGLLATKDPRRGDCQHCGTPVPWTPGHRSRWKYCSEACFRKARYARGSGSRPNRATTLRGYDREHQKLRAKLLPLAYGKLCHLCGEVMEEGEALHLDHTENRTGYRGMSHAACNVLDGARRGGQAFRAKKLAKGGPHGTPTSARRRTEASAA